MLYVSYDEDGMRLDRVLSKRLSISRYGIKNLLIEKKLSITLNHLLCTIKDLRKSVKLNDIIVIKNNIDYSKYNLEFLYEDQYIIIINKPSELIVSSNYLDSVLNILFYRYKYRNIFLLHRLDFNTTGLLIICKGFKVYQNFASLLRYRKLNKFYYCIVSNYKGEIGNRYLLDNYLYYNDRTSNVSVVTNKNLFKYHKCREAITEYRAIKNNDSLTLVEVHLITGRTHQIRSHMAYIGSPIIGDIRYGGISQYRDLKLDKHILHSYNISFISPYTDRYMSFYAKIIDPIFIKLLQHLYLDS